MGRKLLGITEGPCNEEVLMAEALKKGSCGRLIAPAGRVPYGAGRPQRAGTCFVGRYGVRRSTLWMPACSFRDLGNGPRQLRPAWQSRLGYPLPWFVGLG